MLVKGRKMMKTLLYILCWIGVIYFILRLCRFVCLVGRGFAQWRTSGNQKAHAGGDPNPPQYAFGATAKGVTGKQVAQ